MKFSLLPLAAVAIFASTHLSHADEPKPAAAPAFTTQGRWNVRLEVLMVALPEEKALALLPDLLDSTKIDGAYATLMEAIHRKEARLTGYPIVTMLDGQEASSDTRLEKIYPTQFQPPNTPVAFEKRNLGARLTAKCQVSEDGKSLQAEVQAARTELMGFDAYGNEAKIEQPIFFNPASSATLGLRKGQRVLLGFHRSAKGAGDVELFILQATATPLP